MFGVRHVMFGDDRRQLGRSGSPQPLGADAGMVGVDRLAACECRPGPQQLAQKARGQGLEEHGQASFNDRKPGADLAHIVEKRGLLQE